MLVGGGTEMISSAPAQMENPSNKIITIDNKYALIPEMRSSVNALIRRKVQIIRWANMGINILATQ